MCNNVWARGVCAGPEGAGGIHNGPVYKREAVPVHGAADDAAGPREPVLPGRVADHLPRDARCTRPYTLQA